ncbi:haloacid dehalogenase [Gemmobacter lanyuensis]|uniref:(S)-2-haloacid dehalogenase n=1 Tax=Gemmobacter lanyuensis TaxID=1054497 RepID=A0A918IZF1_9RHOB|nr:haloacid dehalogenase type II [Gemmobacter lanyuensis]GGW37976.1 haloacid dehalogenase [Gemmobacter lanyuensis]
MTIRAVVFDAYGTLFDVNAAAREAAAHHALLADVWPDLSQDWRRKQLEYTWLRSLMEDHADFWKITADALDWALEAHGLNDLGLRTRLLDLYRELPAYPEAAAMLAQLKGMGVKRAILSNGTPSMLNSAMTAAGLQGAFDKILSIEEVGIYKPAPRVYDLVMEHFAVEPAGVLFVSSNGWDIAGAGSFGFRTLWVNRAGLPVDRLPHRPHHVAPDLSHLTDLLQ